AGADAVVPVEQTDDQPRGLKSENRLALPPPAQVRVYEASAKGAFVRPIGEDVKTGQVVLREGRVLRAADLGVLAGRGVPGIQVVRRPTVAVLSTGDELLGAGEPLGPGKIRDSNGYTIAALAQQCGAKTVRLGIARDTVADVEAHFQQAIE